MKFVFVTLALLVTTNGYASNIRGMGTDKCQEYLNEKNSPSGHRVGIIFYAHWFMGFLTGVESAGVAKIPSTVSAEILIGKLNYYCTQNPNQYVSDAAVQVAKEYQVR